MAKLKISDNEIYHMDCMRFMPHIVEGGVDVTLTDIPYDEVNAKEKNHPSKIRAIAVGEADVLTFDLHEFLDEVYRITRGTIIIFCGNGQVSEILNYFHEKQNNNEGTVRQLIWEKTNPAVMNGQHIYLSSIENAVWFKKSGATFNAYCKGVVFRHPLGSSKLHPTEKNHALIKELVLDNSNEGDLIFDPCAGSGCHLLMAKQLGRKYLGCELNEKWYKTAKERLSQISIFEQLEVEEEKPKQSIQIDWRLP